MHGAEVCLPPPFAAAVAAAVAAVCPACCVPQPLRDNKPFNPLLGETFEWRAPAGDAW